MTDEFNTFYWHILHIGYPETTNATEKKKVQANSIEAKNREKIPTRKQLATDHSDPWKVASSQVSTPHRHLPIPLAPVPPGQRVCFIAYIAFEWYALLFVIELLDCPNLRYHTYIVYAFSNCSYRHYSRRIHTFIYTWWLTDKTLRMHQNSWTGICTVTDITNDEFYAHVTNWWTFWFMDWLCAIDSTTVELIHVWWLVGKTICLR